MQRVKKVDRFLVIIIFLLMTAGLLIVASTGSPLKGMQKNIFFIKQGLIAALGLLMLFVAMKIPYTLYLKDRFLYSAAGATVFFLILVLFLPSYKNVHRFIVFPGFTLQPSEFAKITLLLFLALFLPRVNWQERWIKVALFPLFLSFTILIEPDLGTSFIFIVVTAVLFFIAGLPSRYVLVVGAITLLFMTAGVFTTSYSQKRIGAFLNRSQFAEKEAYQSIQATMAVGSGKIFGKGIGKSTQKLFYLPQPHTDFAFAIVGEELGFLGSAGMVLLYLGFLFRGTRTALIHPRNEGRILAFGITFLIALQAFIHISVNLSLLPTKGVALPLVSYGGSSLLVTCLLTGILLNISEERE